jgi:hypothetical protein
MRFFTTDLLVRFNSTDDGQADMADAEWEAAIRAYRSHLDQFRAGMSSSVRRLADLNLHDAEFLAVEEVIEPSTGPSVELSGPPAWSAMAIVNVRHGGKVISLLYGLWDRIREFAAPVDWPFSPNQVHWHYDELDLVAGRPGGYLHRVLWSDGRILELPFSSIVIHSFALPSREMPVTPGV